MLDKFKKVQILIKKLQVMKNEIWTALEIKIDSLSWHHLQVHHSWAPPVIAYYTKLIC